MNAHAIDREEDPSNKKIKMAIVCDWLTNMGGAEQALLKFHRAFPEADIYTSVFEPKNCPPFRNLNIRSTYLQKMPAWLRNKHQLFSVLRPGAFRRLDLRGYDVVLSSASAEAKAVRVDPRALHICYCHTPTRYYWSHYEEYRKHPGLGKLDPIVRGLMPPFVRWMRKLDLKAARGVDYFIANSSEVQRRIQKYYHRDSELILSSIAVDRFRPQKAVTKQDYYLVVGRQVPYKRIDLAVEACNRLQRPLIVIGRGSEHDKLVKMAGPTVQFLTGIDDVELVRYYQQAKGFLFPGEEDFGLTPLEAMAADTPVIAFKKAGALDYVIHGKTGIFFEHQQVDSLISAMLEFENHSFDSGFLAQQVDRFDEKIFIQRMQQFVDSRVVQGKRT